jgi:hypothetical protein
MGEDDAAAAAPVGEPRVEARREARVVLVAAHGDAGDCQRAGPVVPDDELPQVAAVPRLEDHRPATTVVERDTDVRRACWAWRRGPDGVREVARHRAAAAADLRPRDVCGEGDEDTGREQQSVVNELLHVDLALRRRTTRSPPNSTTPTATSPAAPAATDDKPRSGISRAMR